MTIKHQLKKVILCNAMIAKIFYVKYFFALILRFKISILHVNVDISSIHCVHQSPLFYTLKFSGVTNLTQIKGSRRNSVHPSIHFLTSLSRRFAGGYLS